MLLMQQSFSSADRICSADFLDVQAAMMHRISGEIGATVPYMIIHLFISWKTFLPTTRILRCTISVKSLSALDREDGKMKQDVLQAY